MNTIHPQYGIPVPLTLTCKVSGKVTVYTAPEYIKKCIEKWGSLENLIANYVCRECREKKGPGAAKKQWQGKAVETPQVEQSTTPIDPNKKDESVLVYSKKFFENKNDTEGYVCNVYVAPSLVRPNPILQNREKTENS